MRKRHEKPILVCVRVQAGAGRHLLPGSGFWEALIPGSASAWANTSREVCRVAGTRSSLSGCNPVQDSAMSGAGLRPSRFWSDAKFQGTMVHRSACMTLTRSRAYTDAGVNIEAGNSLVSRIKSLVSQTQIHGVLSDIGGFGGGNKLVVDVEVIPKTGVRLPGRERLRV